MTAMIQRDQIHTALSFLAGLSLGAALVYAQLRGPEGPPDLYRVDAIATINGEEVEIQRKEVLEQAARSVSRSEENQKILEQGIEFAVYERVHGHGSYWKDRRNARQQELDPQMAQAAKAIEENWQILGLDGGKDAQKQSEEVAKEIRFYQKYLKTIREAEIRSRFVPEEETFALEWRDEAVIYGSEGQDTPIRAVVFSDYLCPFCKAHEALWEALSQRYPDLRVEIRYLPLTGHETSRPAAKASWCAGQQSALPRLHQDLAKLESLQEMQEKDLRQAAKSAGLHMNRYDQCVQSQEAEDAIERDIQEARSHNIQQTPYLIFNGRTTPFWERGAGYWDLDAWILEALKEES